MVEKHTDWKDVANTQFSKALSLALSLLLFAMMVTPDIQVKRESFSSSEITVVDIPPEEREKITPPETEVKIDIPIEISDDPSEGESFDVEAYKAALSEIGELGSVTAPSLTNREEKLFEFTPYDDPPQVVGVLTPEYPPFARSNRIQGRVTLQIQVYRDGSVGDIKILKSDSPLLNDAAIAAIKKVRFQPGKSGGNPVDTTVNIPIDFRLN